MPLDPSSLPHTLLTYMYLSPPPPPPLFGKFVDINDGWIRWVAIHFEDRVCASKKRWDSGRWWISALDVVHMAADLARYRKAMVGTGWALFDTNGHR